MKVFGVAPTPARTPDGSQMWGQDAKRKGLPVSGHAKWALPDARGLGTGPRTPEGLERSRRANWKHGDILSPKKRRKGKFGWRCGFFVLLVSCRRVTGCYESALERGQNLPKLSD
jgi:hypothetical protein